MISLITISKAQKLLASHMRKQRLNMGLTQAGLSKRSGVPLPSIRKFEQQSVISLESYLKLLMALGGLDAIVQATTPEEKSFQSINDVINNKPKKKPAPLSA